MGMGIGINVQTNDYGELSGYQEAIACGVWFTSTGCVMPKLIKYKSDNGEICRLSNIHTINYEQKFYCGIPTLEYNCSAFEEGVCYYFRLLYYTEKQTWKILWKHQKEF